MLFCCHFRYLGDDELLCSVRGSDACYHSECAKEAVGSSTLKRFKCPLHVCFICKKKKQFWCVRCKVAFHSKCAAWSDSVLQLKDHPGHTVCWRHPYDWHLDWKLLYIKIFVLKKWKYIKMPDLPFQVGDLAESRCFEKVVIVVHGLDARFKFFLL
ncbi:hypothetical protein AAZX31_13G354000 [Glycine max]